MKIPTNIEEFECMEHICDQIIPIIEFENRMCTLKVWLLMEFLGEFFCDVWYWYTSIKYRIIWKLKILDEIPFKNCVFLHLFNNECIITSFFKQKTTTISRGGDFINGHYIIFSIFFCLVIFHESQTWNPMVIEKL